LLIWFKLGGKGWKPLHRISLCQQDNREWRGGVWVNLVFGWVRDSVQRVLHFDGSGWHLPHLHGVALHSSLACSVAAFDRSRAASEHLLHGPAGVRAVATCGRQEHPKTTRLCGTREAGCVTNTHNRARDASSMCHTNVLLVNDASQTGSGCSIAIG
jgi:hypothetical protein